MFEYWRPASFTRWKIRKMFLIELSNTMLFSITFVNYVGFGIRIFPTVYRIWNTCDWQFDALMSWFICRALLHYVLILASEILFLYANFPDCVGISSAWYEKGDVNCKPRQFKKSSNSLTCIRLPNSEMRRIYNPLILTKGHYVSVRRRLLCWNGTLHPSTYWIPLQGRTGCGNGIIKEHGPRNGIRPARDRRILSPE